MRRLAGSRTGICRWALVTITTLVGAALWSAAPAVAAPGIEGLTYRPALKIAGTFGDYGDHGDPNSGIEYVEPIADGCYARQATGATLQIHIRNRARVSSKVESVEVNGVDANELADRPDNDPSRCDEDGIRWWRAAPQSIAAGGFGTISLNGTAFAPGRTVQIRVRTSTGAVSTRSTLTRPQARIVALRFSPDLDRMRAYLEPLSIGEHRYRVRRVTVDGRTLAARVSGTLGGRGTVLVGAPLRGISPGEQANVSITLSSGHRRIHLFAAQRFLASSFPIGIGVGFALSALPVGEDAAKLADSGIRALVAFDQAFSIPDLLEAAGQGGFRAYVGPGIPGPGQNHTDTTEELLAAIPELKNDPRIAGWVPYDEPDIPFAEPNWRYRTSSYIQGVIDRVQQLDPSRPTFLNLWSPNAASEYGLLADVNGWDHYVLDREPLALESAREFARSNMAATSPGPFWFWNQALAYGQGRVPSDQETRVYTSLGVGHGATGVLWFAYDGHTTERPLWPEMSAESRVLAALAPHLRSSSSWPQGARPIQKDLDAGSVISPNLALLTVSNLEYQLGGTTPSVFTPRSGVQVQWRMPPWLGRRSDIVIAEVTPGEGLHRVGEAKRTQTIEVGPLTSSRWYIAAPRETVKRLEQRLRQPVEPDRADARAPNHPLAPPD